MRFGLFGGAHRAPTGASGDSQTYRRFIDYVAEAEQLGFTSVFLVEHHFTGSGQISASLTLLSYLAAMTSTLRLGTAVTVLPWHNPVLLAEQAATVDLLSGGRLEFGVGRGYRPNEFHGFNVDPAEAADRYAECLDILLRSWTTDGRFSHEGKFWTFRDVVVEPKPAQSPHPPIWVAAGSEGSIRAAAASGYRLLLDQFATPDQTFERIDWYRGATTAAGRVFDPRAVAVTRGLLLLESNDPAVREAEVNRRITALGKINQSSQVPGSSAPPTGSFFNDSRLSTEEAAILGPPDECVERLKVLEAAGVQTVLFNDLWGGADRLRRFARDVMPAFA
ncbi:MAG: LLM class flavin-dependent oxidoreductase [Nitriliruptorales bacterium]|nr:LLM class flavin-dependent oxidoreductase [Nitriliruptorales bacterium]